MDTQSRSSHITELAKEIIDDIEFTRLDAQVILLKTTRLPRYVGNEEIREWLRYEMQGYQKGTDTFEKYMVKTGRWTNKDERKGYIMPLAQVEGTIVAETEKLKAYRIPDTSSQYAVTVIDNVRSGMSGTSSYISTLSGIKSRVISILHDFATTVYYEKVFDNIAESIFDNYKKAIDLLIAENSGDIIEQIPSVIARLSDGDRESISHALTTCRRIIDSFADHIFPPIDETINVGGKEISLKADKVINRITTYVYNNCKSESRRTKIKQNLENLYKRVSAGVHSDVDTQEARNIFFNVYLILGEILTLPPKQPTSTDTSV